MKTIKFGLLISSIIISSSAMAGSGALGAVASLGGNLANGQVALGDNTGTLNASSANSGDSSGEGSKIKVSAALVVNQAQDNTAINIQIGAVDNSGTINATALNSGDASSGGDISVCAAGVCNQ